MNWTLYPISEIGALAAKWNALNEAAGSLPFLDTRFVVPLCEVFGNGNLKIALCEDARGPIAMGVFERHSSFQWETFQPSQIPLGAWVMRPGHELEALLSGLARKLPGLTLAIGLTQQDPNCVPRPTQSPLLQTLDYIQTATLPVSGSFEQYWGARGKNLRQNMRKQRVKLEKDGVSTHLEMLTRPEDVAQAIADYGQLESAGWKAAGGTAIHPDNAQGRFYRSMLEAFCSARAARIYRYRFGDKVVAVDLCIEGGGALVILKTTYDESIRTISPAFLMREEAFKALFDEGRIGRIEFFGRLMDWHLRWTDVVRTLYHVNYYRSLLVPRVQAALKRYRKPTEVVASREPASEEGSPPPANPPQRPQ